MQSLQWYVLKVLPGLELMTSDKNRWDLMDEEQKNEITTKESKIASHTFPKIVPRGVRAEFFSVEQKTKLLF